MIFNSVSFLVFFASFFLLYWLVVKKNLQLQNLFILTGSYIFYAWSDSQFLFLLIAVSALNFYLGIRIEKATSQTRKRLLLFTGIFLGVGCLLFFKYFNFFIGSFSGAFASLGIDLDPQTFNIIVPLGISFFTFRLLGYLLDVDKGKTRACTDWVVFFTYVSFFPTLLSGPIDRATTFIPQLEKRRYFEYKNAVGGLHQILWGLFKKVIIADSCAGITNHIFENYHALPASSLVLGAFLFTIQLYADFSGYSDMAIGCSRLLGFTVTENFNFPFFSRSIAEFWRKWHMSLTTWLTDYVFTPLSIAFRDYGKKGLMLSILVTFVLIGVWHGANWTFILFGLIHGCFYIPIIVRGEFYKRKKIPDTHSLVPSFREVRSMLGTFLILMLTIVLFRAENVSMALSYYKKIFSYSIIAVPELTWELLTTMIFIAIMLLVEWFQRNGKKIEAVYSFKQKYPALYFTFFIAGIFLFMNLVNKVPFIYFKF